MSMLLTRQEHPIVDVETAMQNGLLVCQPRGYCGPFINQDFYDAFPVAGVDGTLRTRMRGTAAEANARGKTGTLSNVRSLSGYVTTADGRLLLYSVLCNNYLVPTSYISRVQDTIAVRLSRLRDLRAYRGDGN